MISALFLAILALSAQALAQDKWYGTYGIQVHHTYDHTEADAKEDGSSRTERIQIQRTSSATVTFPATGKVKVALRGKYWQLTNLELTNPVICTPSDTQGESLYFATTLLEYQGSTNRTAPDWPIEVNFEDDGTYSITMYADVYTELPGQQHGTYFRRSTCPNQGPESGDHTDKLNMPLMLEDGTATGKASADTTHIQGYTTETRDFGQGKVVINVAWNLNRAKPVKLKAVANAPKVMRGDTVELDGSKSTGTIERYDWLLLPADGCPEDLPVPIRLEGAKQSFQILCSLQGFLSVSGGGETDTTEVRIEVTPRDWKTTFTEQPEKTFVEPVTKLHFFVGKNRCAIESAEPNHFIHGGGTGFSWKGDGFDVAQVAEGPFAGYWYVGRADLKIDRQIWINSSILEGGEVYRLNIRNNSADLLRLQRQVRAHEKLHSTVVKERLDKGGPDFDPELAIEKMIGRDEEVLSELVDRKIRFVETELRDSSEEPQIHIRMRAIPEFVPGGKIILPDGSGGVTTVPYRSFADLSQ